MVAQHVVCLHSLVKARASTSPSQGLEEPGALRLGCRHCAFTLTRGNAVARSLHLRENLDPDCGPIRAHTGTEHVPGVAG